MPAAARLVQKIVIGSDTSDLDRGLNRASSNIGAFAKRIGVAMGALAIGAGVVAGIRRVSDALGDAIIEADKLGKTAQKIGIPVDELSKLQHAADLSGVSMAQLTTGVGRLSQNLEEFNATGGGEAARVFKALGIEATDANGQLKSSSQIITEVADRFSGMEDGAEKTAFAMELFGRAGRDMIPLLNTGSAGLRDMMREAEQLGLVIDQRTSDAAQAFNDDLNRLSKVMDGVWNAGVRELAPVLADVAEQLANAAKEGKLFETAGNVVENAIRRITVVAIGTQTVFERLGASWAALTKLWESYSFAELQANWQNLERVITENRKALDTISERAEQYLAGLNTIGGGARGANTAFDELRESVKEFLDSLPQEGDEKYAAMIAWSKQLVEDANKWAASFDKAGVAAKKFQDRVAKTNEGTAKFADEVKKKWAQAGDSMASSFSEMGASIGSSSAGAAKALKITGAAMALINALTAQSFALATPFPGSLAALATIVAKGMAVVASIRSVSVPSFSTGGSFRVGGGVSGVDNQIIPMAVRSGEEVIVRTPEQAAEARASAARLAAAVSAITEGLAPIKQIPSLSMSAIPGFAQGGGFTVGGGVSGVDNKRFMVDLASGENFTVTRPEQAGGSVPQIVELELKGQITDLIRSELSDFIDMLNDAFADGYKLKVT